ncbi:MAG: uroporphyrinogen decarboxylase [Planctomycetaceae bacterium]
MTATTPAPVATVLSARDRFLRACACEPVDRPPVWLMRQAGRVLPEYRALKERHDFLELVRTPELAAEVTLQPIRRFGFDAAIIFSDILVIPEALGLPYRFRDGGGVAMDRAIRSAEDVERLAGPVVEERLAYVADALRLVKRELAGQTALIGFAGSPWTVACFLIAGGSGAGFPRARELLARDRAAYDLLAERLTAATIRYLRMQIDAGAEVVQVFDTLGGLLGPDEFQAASGRWLGEIVRGVAGRVPVIVFAKGAHANWSDLVATGAQVLGFDSTADLGWFRDRLPARVGIQGNLDPAILETTPDRVAAETRRVLESMRGRAGHVFNLGHGVPPGAPLENLESLMATVRSFR